VQAVGELDVAADVLFFGACQLEGGSEEGRGAAYAFPADPAREGDAGDCHGGGCGGRSARWVGARGDVPASVAHMPIPYTTRRVIVLCALDAPDEEVVVEAGMT
jgi:hypothetical protein